MKLALGWLRKRGLDGAGSLEGETVTDQPSQLPTAPIGVRTTGGLHAERSRRSCARTTPSVISDWFTDVRGEPCAEPSEGGRLQPLTAENIIARWVSMIISERNPKSQTTDSNERLKRKISH